MWVGAAVDGCLLPSVLFSLGLSCNGPQLLLAMPTMTLPKPPCQAALSLWGAHLFYRSKYGGNVASDGSPSVLAKLVDAAPAEVLIATHECPACTTRSRFNSSQQGAIR